jgi:hypothetical protein
VSLAFSSSILLTDETFIALQPTLIKLFGRSAAQVLAALHSWLQRSKNLIDGVYWVYNTYAQWTAKIPGLSIRTLQRVMTALERLGIIHSDRKEAHQWYQRKWYTIDYDRLNALISSNPPTCPDPCRQNGEFINKDFYIENLKTTNTSEATCISVDPPTHPVPKMEIEVNKGVTGFQPFQTGDDLNLEIQFNSEIQDPQPTLRVKPKLKPKQTLNSATQTISPPPPVEIPAEIEAQIVRTIAPVSLHRNLRKQVLQAQIHVIQDAITLVQQQKAAGKVKNPAGLLVKAIQHQWKPNQPSSSPPPLPDDFNEWFELARQSGLAIASMLIDGVLCIRTTAEKWEPYEDFRAAFSLPWLRRSPLVSLQIKSHDET